MKYAIFSDIHGNETAKKCGETSMPVSDAVWKLAVDTWDIDKPVPKEFFE